MYQVIKQIDALYSMSASRRHTHLVNATQIARVWIEVGAVILTLLPVPLALLSADNTRVLWAEVSLNLCAINPPLFGSVVTNDALKFCVTALAPCRQFASDRVLLAAGVWPVTSRQRWTA